MAATDHYKVAYAEAVKELAGSQDRALLPEFCTHYSKQGEIVFMDAIAPDTEARETAVASTKTRERYEAIGSPDLDDWLDLQTPHMAISKQRTAMTALCIDWGHHFNKETELAELADPKGNTLRMAMKRIWKKRDARFIAALAAATVTRGKDAANLSSVAFPDAQKIVIDTGAGADGTEDLTSISKDLFGLVREKFENQFAGDERIFLLMNPAHKRTLIVNSGDKILSADFVEKASYFESGKLPNVYGVIPMVHPAVAAGVMYAWTPDALAWNQWSPLVTNLAQSAEQRFHWIAYMEEYLNCVRVDDNLVVQITVQATAAS